MTEGSRLRLAVEVVLGEDREERVRGVRLGESGALSQAGVGMGCSFCR
jgi:hypothetical protein